MRAVCKGEVQVEPAKGADGRRWEDEWWWEVEERSGPESGLMKKKEYENGS